MIPGINKPYGFLHDLTGASVDELKLISSFLISYPLAAVLKRLPDDKPWQKNVFIIAISLFYLIGLFDLYDGIRTIMYSAAGTYAVAYYIDGSLMPWIAFVFLMGHLSVNQLSRQFANNPSAVDITGQQMVMVMKLSAFAWNVHDGRLRPELLTETQKEKAIYKMPGFLDYTAYVLFFPSLFTGPAFDFVDYKQWITTTMFAPKPNEPAPPTRKQRKIPQSGTTAAYKAVIGLLWIAVYVQASGMYNVPLVLSDTYANYSLLRRIWILYALGLTARTKYYGVWTMTEGACILTGLGYNGIDPKTKKPKWDRLENVYPWGIESGQNSRGYLENWNKNTNHWLRNYVYLRVTPKGKKPGFRASLATFSTSAFWHGFYPGYYLTFVLAAFIQTVSKNFRRFVRPFFLTPDGKQPTSYKIYYDVASWFVTQFAYCFCTAPFVVLGFGDSIRVWSRVYFYAIFGVGASMAFFASPAKGYLISKLDQRNHPHDTSELRRTRSLESINMPVLGMADDPAREIDEALEEIKKEVGDRRRRGSKVDFPSGDRLRKMIEERIQIRMQRGESIIEGDGTAKPQVDLDMSQGLVTAEIQDRKKDR